MKYKASYFCKLSHYFFSITLFFIYSVSHAATTASPVSSNVELYNTFTLKLLKDDITTNKFSKFPEVIFTKGEKTFTVDGFFDGDENGSASGNIWKVRFMPDEEGLWDYSWNFEGDIGTGSFNVIAKTNDKIFGHVSRDGRFLKTDDGTSFLFRGANWIRTGYLRATEDFGGQPNLGQLFISDSDWLAYVDRLAETGHNGNFLHKMTRLMNNDRTSFDLAWLKRIDFALESSGERGIYTFLGLMNTWDRSASEPFLTELSSANQLLHPWNKEAFKAAKEFYLRYLVARYAGYYNVLWELGNEMERSPNSGSAFTAAANEYYIPWLRQYDPYDLPITLSENIWTSASVDIGGFHQAQTIKQNETRPVIHTEFVSGGASGFMYLTSTYRNPADRIHYRRGFWKGMIEGGSGAIECSNPFESSNAFNSVVDYLSDANVQNVMADHGRLGAFLLLPDSQLNSFLPKGTSGLGTSNTAYKYRRNNNSEYLAYFYGAGSAMMLSLTLPPGNYAITWYSPSTGLSSTQNVSNNSSVTSPWSNEYDVAIYITAGAQTVPAPPSAEKLLIN